MKVTTIKYGRTFSLGNFCSERIDMEAVLDEGEAPDAAMQELKKKVDDFHKQYNPLEEAVIFSAAYTPTPEEEKQNTDQPIIDQINECTDLVVLKSFEMLTKKRPLVGEAYFLKMTLLLNDFLDKKNTLLSEEEFFSATRILSNRETKSYNKLFALLQSK